MVMDDTPAFPAVFLGAIRAGMVPVPLNPLFKPDDYRYLLADSEATAVVADLDLLPKVGEALAGHGEPVPVVAGGAAEGAHPLDDLLAEHAGELGPASTHRDDAAFWLYSSGSTGRPKGWSTSSTTCPTPARPMGPRCSASARATSSCRRPSCSTPTGSATACRSRSGGGDLGQLYGLADPRPGAGRRRAPPAEPAVLGPNPYNAMLATPEAKRDLSSVRLCVSAAESLPAEIWRRWHDTFGQAILDGIGSTEMLHIFCSNTADRLRPGSSGTAVPGYDLKLLGDESEPVPKGETAPCTCAATAPWPATGAGAREDKADGAGGLVWTGDRYRQDADGFWWHQGRVDDMLKVGGLWVSPVEMEQALAEHLAVYECAVVQVLHDGLDLIKAVVVRGAEADPGQLTGELQAWCKQRLQRHESPHIVEYTDELPKTTTGKIQRFKLREGEPAG